MGYPATPYTQDEVAAGRLEADGINVLVISRVATLGPVSPAYVAGIKSYIATGGSVLGEFDGAALFFTSFAQPTAIVLNFTPSFGLITGSVTGGGLLLPLVNSTTYVTDAADPILAGVPATFLAGARSGFAITGFNDNWMHVSASFNSAGYQGQIPVGNFPAVVSGQCGGGRIALYNLNYLSSITVSPVSTMVTNTLNWLAGH